MPPIVTFEPVDPAADAERLVRFLCGNPWPFHARPILHPDDVAAMDFVSSATSSSWGIVDGDDVALVRLLDLEDLDVGSPLFDLRVAAAARGSGVGTAAVEWLTGELFDTHPSLARVEATTRIDNVGMRIVLERCGYVLEGRIRESWPTEHGIRVDTAVYGALRRDRDGNTARARAESTSPARDAAPVATGHCLCGAVSFAVRGSLRDVFHCHCERCRRFTGHHMAATAADTAAIEVDDDGALAWYLPHPTVDYGFCRRCGSSLFWRALDRPARLSICAGALDQPTGLRTSQAWWVSDVADYHTRDRSLVEHDRDG